jgi:hypothetical protein
LALKLALEDVFGGVKEALAGVVVNGRDADKRGGGCEGTIGRGCVNGSGNAEARSKKGGGGNGNAGGGGSRGLIGSGGSNLVSEAALSRAAPSAVLSLASLARQGSLAMAGKARLAIKFESFWLGRREWHVWPGSVGSAATSARRAG